MNSILRVWVLCASSLVGLQGCGGGGGAPAGDDGAVPPASACLPTAEVMDRRVKAMSSYAEVVEQMGCQGRLLSETNASGQTVRMYDWGQVESGPHALLEFRDDRLHGWTTKGMPGAEPASCLPTRAAADRLVIGMDITQVSGTVGCTGQSVSRTVDYLMHWDQSDLAWGDITSGPYLMVTIKDNKLFSFASQRL